MARSRHHRQPSEILQVVLDDLTVDRLRQAAVARDVEIEQLIVHVLHLASWRLDDLLDAPGQNI